GEGQRVAVTVAHRSAHEVAVGLAIARVGVADALQLGDAGQVGAARATSLADQHLRRTPAAPVPTAAAPGLLRPVGQRLLRRLGRPRLRARRVLLGLGLGLGLLGLLGRRCRSEGTGAVALATPTPAALAGTAAAVATDQPVVSTDERVLLGVILEL